MYVDRGLQIFQGFFNQLSNQLKWAQFLKLVGEYCFQFDDDLRSISKENLQKALSRFNIKYTDESIQLLLNTFPAKGGQERGDYLVVDKLFEVRVASKLNQAYTLVEFEGTDEDEVAIDASGYTGNFRRENNRKKDQKLLKFDELLEIIRTRNCMLDIMRRIKEIDREFNGYVTTTELEDILRLSYAKELTGFNLKFIFRKYASIQNKILIDYRTFRDDIIKGLKQVSNEEKKMKVVELLMQKSARAY